MSDSMNFPTLTVLTVTSGRLLTPIGDLYKILGYMTDDEPFTHQLGRFAEECKPWILRWNPSLGDFTSEIEKRCDAGDIEGLAFDLVQKLGAEITVHKIPKDDHAKKEPYDELVEMLGTDENIVLVIREPE